MAKKDYILRTKAIKAVTGWETDPTDEELELALMDIPAADVQEVRHGRWKPFDLTWGRSVYACTSCGEAMEVPTECGKPMYEFCPNCGAKMDEVEE